MEDTRKVLEKILIQEMRRQGLAMTTVDELRRQRLLKSSDQLATMARELDKYASIPGKYVILIDDMLQNIYNVWSELKEENVVFEEDEE